jgi:hypothetical protein
MKKYLDLFDTSVYPENQELCSDTYKKVIGQFEDEHSGVKMLIHWSSFKNVCL